MSDLEMLNTVNTVDLTYSQKFIYFENLNENNLSLKQVYKQRLNMHNYIVERNKTTQETKGFCSFISLLKVPITQIMWSCYVVIMRLWIYVLESDRSCF